MSFALSLLAGCMGSCSSRDHITKKDYFNPDNWRLKTEEERKEQEAKKAKEAQKIGTGPLPDTMETAVSFAFRLSESLPVFEFGFLPGEFEAIQNGIFIIYELTEASIPKLGPVAR